MKNTKSRKELLEVLFSADKVYTMEESKGDINLIDYTEIYTTVLWLEKELEIPKLENMITVSGRCCFVIEKSKFSHRQYFCYSKAMIHLYENRLGSSYHEMCDFIHNYRYTMEESISMMEKALLGMWIRAFKFSYEKHTCDNYEI